MIAKDVLPVTATANRGGEAACAGGEQEEPEERGWKSQLGRHGHLMLRRFLPKSPHVGDHAPLPGVVGRTRLGRHSSARQAGAAEPDGTSKQYAGVYNKWKAWARRQGWAAEFESKQVAPAMRTSSWAFSATLDGLGPQARRSSRRSLP